MGDRVAGKVALVTGAARGQGRADALRLAQEGADLIVVDVCAPLPSVAYDSATPEDLAATVRQIEKTGQRVIAGTADIRDLDTLRGLVDDAVRQPAQAGRAGGWHSDRHHRAQPPAELALISAGIVARTALAEPAMS